MLVIFVDEHPAGAAIAKARHRRLSTHTLSDDRLDLVRDC
jgi:hypothetical protein